MLGAEFSKTPSVGYGWRVKLYQLESEGAGAWQDQGTGNVICKTISTGPAIVVMNELEDESIAPLLQSKIQIDSDVYERQGESIIMWRESGYSGDVDYALSFQDTAGCHAIWTAIGEVQTQYNQQREYGVLPTFSTPGYPGNSDSRTIVGGISLNGINPLLPEVTSGSLQEIRDRLISSHAHPSPSLRDSYINLILQKDSDFFHRLITIYSDMEDLEDIEGLTKIAEIVRAILFLNDPAILDYVLTDNVFVHIAGALEYDPALKCRAEFREFLTSRARHVQVIAIENVSLKQAITLLFRLKYLRDVMLRPTIEDTGVSALNSLISFTTADICTKVFDDLPYLSRILKIINPHIDVSALAPDTQTALLNVIVEINGQINVKAEERAVNGHGNVDNSSSSGAKRKIDELNSTLETDPSIGDICNNGDVDGMKTGGVIGTGLLSEQVNEKGEGGETIKIKEENEEDEKDRFFSELKQQETEIEEQEILKEASRRSEAIKFLR
jgi:hypothetical protein